MNIDDLRILVTGGARGLGRHFCQALAREGAKVAAMDVDPEGLSETAGAVADAAGTIHTYAGSVADEADVARVVATAADALGGLNALVNCAGIFRDALLVKRSRRTGELERMSLAQWQAVMDVDLTGPFLMTREVVTQMLDRETGSGVIVNISSTSKRGNRGQSNYSAAKAGLVADTRVWAAELARHQIRVAAIAPGFVDTPILQGMRPEVLEAALKRVPLQRAGQPAELYEALRFIVRCDYLTGTCIDVDGGLTL